MWNIHFSFRPRSPTISLVRILDSKSGPGGTSHFPVHSDWSDPDQALTPVTPGLCETVEVPLDLSLRPQSPLFQTSSEILEVRYAEDFSTPWSDSGSKGSTMFPYFYLARNVTRTLPIPSVFPRSITDPGSFTSRYLSRSVVGRGPRVLTRPETPVYSYSVNLVGTFFYF